MSWLGAAYFIGFGAVTVSIGWWFENKRIKNHQAKLAKLRPDLADEQFVIHFEDLETDPDIALWVRNEIDGYKYADLAVHWDDELWNFYRIDEEELIFILEQSFGHFDIPLPATSDPLDITNLLTVGDCISFLDRNSKKLADDRLIA